MPTYLPGIIERSFLGNIGGASPPPALAGLLSPSADPAVSRWMGRNGTSPEAVAQEAWAVLKLLSSISFVAALCVGLLAGLSALSFLALPLILFPIIVASHFSNRPARCARAEEADLLRHGPDAIGSMMMSMGLSPSLESAVVFSASVNHDALGRRLADAAWSVLVRTSPDMQTALLDLASSLSQANDGLRQALHLLLASTYEPTKEGAQRILDKANDLVLTAFRDTAERYIASLSAPVMVLFSLGILLPVMMFSVVPLLSLSSALPVGGTSGVPSSSFPVGALGFLLVVVVPLATLFYSRSVLGRNPIAAPPPLKLGTDRTSRLFLCVWLTSLGLLIAFGFPLRSPYAFLLLAGLPPCIFLVRRTLSEHRRASSARKEEGCFITGLYQLGNRLSTGAGLERSLREASASSQGDAFSRWADKVLMQAKLGKRGVHELLLSDPELERINPVVAGAYSTMAKCALRDPLSSGQVTVGLAKNLSDVRALETTTEEKLRGVVDMMRATSLMFAPIVLGITGGLFSLTGIVDPGAQVSVELVTVITGVYVFELALVVSYFTTFLMGARSWSEVGYQFGVRAPLAILVFTAISLCARTGFSRLL